MKARAATKIVSWSLYDLAVKFFTLNIVSLHFVRWITIEKGLADIFYSLAFGSSLLIVFVFSPFIGKLSDVTGKKRAILSLFTLSASALVAFLGFTHNAFLALVFFALANLSIQLAVIVYNALISAVADSGKLGFVSGFGKMLGFIGALAIVYLMTPIRESYGYHRLFQASGLLLFIFSLPCMLIVKERKTEKLENLKQAISFSLLLATFRSTFRSLKDLCQSEGIKDLLKASFFALCPINVLILFMAVYLSKVFGLDEAGIVNVIAVASLAAILSSISFGVLGDRIGYKKTLYFVFGLMLFGFVLVSLTDAKAHSFWLGGLFGLIYGAIMAVPRALAAALVPDEKIGELFGFFAWMGYLAGIAGPLTWGFILLVLSPLGVLRYRIAIVLIGLFILPSLYYFMRIPERGGKNE